MPRRRSIYSPPKLKLKQKTVIAVASLVSFMLALVSVVTIATEIQTLEFWRKILSRVFGWLAFTSPIVFLLTGLVLQKVKWKFAQMNVLLGFGLLIISLTSLTAAVSPDLSGDIGATLWEQLASFVTEIGAFLLLVGVFLVGLVVLFNTSLSQIFHIFTLLFGLIYKLGKK